MTVFCENFDSVDSLAREFNEHVDTFKELNLLFAFYEYEDYSGDAYVLYEKDGKLFEVSGGHCSCYGLEDQWSPDETTKEALLHWLTHGKTRFGSYEKELLEVVRGLA